VVVVVVVVVVSMVVVVVDDHDVDWTGDDTKEGNGPSCHE
jgi:ABC-type cobalt transport system substrate-binding protein